MRTILTRARSDVQARWRSNAPAVAACVEIVRAYPGTSRVVWDNVDIDAFLSACDQHRVACFLETTFDDESSVPQPVLQRSRLVELRRKFNRARVRRDLEVVDAAFGSADLPWVVLKGPALVEGVYRGAARESSDLDLLVAGQLLEAALAALVHSGCVLLDQNFDLLSAMGSGEVSVLLPNGTIGDLHWHPIHERRVRRHFQIDTAELLARRVRVGGGSGRLPTLDATDTVLYLCLHACLSGGDRLLWAKDIELSLRELLWSHDELVVRAHRTGTNLAVALMLARSAREMGTAVDADLQFKLTRGAFWYRVVVTLERLTVGQPLVRRTLLRQAYRATRESSLASLRELLRAGVYASVFRRRADLSRPWRIKGSDGRNPALVSSAPRTRERFFDEVRREHDGLSS